jgi:hypothetical protein
MWLKTTHRYLRPGINAKLVFILFCVFVTPVTATEHLTAEELQGWFNDDLSNDEERALAVNEGELAFLSKQPEKAVHYSRNILTITRDSLNVGWISLKQCHANLDAVAASQIVYRYKRMRNLMVDSFEGIRRVWVEGNAVQLEDIQQGARLCIRADVRILYLASDGGAVLKNGPFHRKYFDGYYPMHVTLEIQYPDDLLRYESIRPKAQPGFSVTQTNNTLHVDAWFEGELRTEVRFSIIHRN